MADSLAKKGTTITQNKNVPLSFHSAKIIIQNTLRKKAYTKFYSESETKQWKNILDKNLISSGLRLNAAALF